MVALAPTPGGVSNMLDITAATVVKATGGNIVVVCVSGTPTAGALTINDCATTGAAAASNQIASIPFGSLTAMPIHFDFFVTLNGITISAVPTGAAVAISYA